VLGVEDALGGAGQQLFEKVLALSKPRAAQIEAVKIEKVERVVEQPVPTTDCDIGVQQPEIRHSTGIGDDRFTIQNEVVRRHGRERIRDRLEAPRPVVSSPRVDGRPPVLQVRLRAVAVELDLVQPALA
jgi:hypothetical protein